MLVEQIRQSAIIEEEYVRKYSVQIQQNINPRNSLNFA
jgi:hypothetical protein